jgi:hypothetical protein
MTEAADQPEEVESRDGRAAPAGPIFLGGPARSGKTLMRWMLSSLPHVAISRRTGMWPRFYGRFGDLGRSENLERCLQAMLAHKQVAALAPDLDRIRREFKLGPPSYARLFALVHEHYAQRCGKDRWGDQTGLIERFADPVMAAYPEAKIVHMIRDPRDCYQAVLEREPRKPDMVGRITGRWLTSVALAGRNRQRYPGRYKVVGYESLVTSPEQTMREVCSFLEEEFRPSMLMLEGVRRYEDLRAAVGGRSPISTAYVGRFRARLDPCDLAFIQKVAGKQMLALGYVPEPVSLTARQRIHSTLVWPRALARLGVCHVEEKLDARRTFAAAGSVS